MSIDKNVISGFLSTTRPLRPLLKEAIALRKERFGNTIKIHILDNAKEGGCTEDCLYCGQSARYNSHIESKSFLSTDTLINHAKIAKSKGAYRFCMAIARRNALSEDIKSIGKVVRFANSKLGLKTCFSSGFLSKQDLIYLKGCGIDRINHNLNTSNTFYPKICTTHTYEDRFNMARSIKAAGIGLCSGIIIGMGESINDLVDLFFDLKRLNPDSIPVNFLVPIKGTPLENTNYLTPKYCLRVLCALRILMPSTEIRVAAGREYHLGTLEPLSLLISDSTFLGNYLTTQGTEETKTIKVIKALGLYPVNA